MGKVSERTPLLKENLDSNLEPYDKKSRSFCTRLFVGIGFLVLTAFAAVIIWRVVESKSVAETQKEDALNVLLQNEYPRLDDQAPVQPHFESLITLINEAVDEGKQQLEVSRLKSESGDALESSSPSYKHQLSIVYSPFGSNLSDYGYVEGEATKYLRDKGVQSVINYDSATNLEWANETDCHRNAESSICEVTPYRSIHGSCNNLKHPQKWGVAFTPFRRALTPAYDDSVSAPRGGFNSSLPSARDISTKIHRPVYQKDENFTVMLAVWGQFLDHDITATALSRGVNGTPIACCNSKLQHPECFPVFLKSDDPHYSKFNLSCMEFARSAPALRCSFGPREQLNQASSYIDGSMVYGNSESLADRLRTFNNGELEMLYTSDGRALLPVSRDPADGCNQLEEIKKGKYCFISGDTRANENTNLISMHLILARQHNNISSLLRAFNPFWNDEMLYQESRRILAAQLQHITYNEFLPGIIGEQLMEKLELYSYQSGYWTKYNDSIDASVSNNFAAATFRFAHSLIPRMMKLLANDTESPEYVEMHKMLFNPFGIYDGELDSIIRGAFNSSIEKADNFFTEQLTKHLFKPTSVIESSTKSFGLDLVSLNIQRGRDHGLPPYVEFRKYCNLSSVNNYDDLKGIFDEKSLASVASLYKSVRDIDLYTGGLSEIPITGGLLGPTLTCLIADQFYRIKHGDRFWYETNEKPQAFTPKQLEEIRKTSLAGIICQNADDLQTVTPSVMRSTSDSNKRVPCSQIPQPNISVWQENPEKQFGLNVIHIKIVYPKRVFTWNNRSDAPLPPELLSNGQLTSAEIRKIRFNQTNIVELNGTFVFVSKEGRELTGLFELTAETSTHVHIDSARIKFPIYVSDNSTDKDLSNSSRIILHTVPISAGKLIWTGNVSINLIPLFWNNNTDHRKLNETDRDESQKKVAEPSTSKTTDHQGQKKYPEDSGSGLDGDRFSVPSKRVSNANSETDLAGNKSSVPSTSTRDSNFEKADHQGQKEYPEDSGSGLDGGRFVVPSKRVPNASSETVLAGNKFLVPSTRAQDSNFEKAESPKNETNDLPDVHRPQKTDESSTSRIQAAETINRTKESDLKKDYEFLKKNAAPSHEEEEVDADEIYTTVPDFASTNDSSHEDNILYHILENRTREQSNDTTLEDDELEFLHDLSPNSSIYSDNRPKPRPSPEEIIPVSISVKQVQILNYTVLNPPADITVTNIENQTVIWDFNSIEPLMGTFELGHENGTFKIVYDIATNKDLGLNPFCKFYSKISIAESVNESNLFDLDLEGLPKAEGCTIIAPLQLHGESVSPGVFRWNGSVTIRVRKPRKDLNREDELSLNLKPKEIFNLDSINGTIWIDHVPLWNGSLPALFHVDNLGWYSTKRAVAYPITWSGDYEDSNLIGNMVVLERTNATTVERKEGNFSINVPQTSVLREIIQPFDIYQSIVYLTDEPSYIQQIDIFQFDAIDEWDSLSASRIILIGQFVESGFAWSGKVIYIVPRDVENKTESEVTTSYRPRGKYVAKIFDGTLFAVLDNSLPVLKWWSGVLPPMVVIPASLPQLKTYKLLFNKAVLWSYEEQNGSRHAVFKTYGNESKIHLFGDFQFQLTSVFEQVKTATLKPRVTYYSPLVLQGEDVYTTETDLITKLGNVRNPSAGVFAPIMLLGNYTDNGKFEWNLTCLVHVADD